MKFGFIARYRTVWPVRVMCRVMTVSASGYYDGAARSPSQRSQTNARLTTLIRDELCSQYTSEDFQRLLVKQGITCSMSRRGECWDNAAMESFFSTLKIERVFRSRYKTRDEARAEIFD